MPRIVDVREASVAISRYDDDRIPSGGLTTSIVAITTDVQCDGKPVTGFGFSSIGRFAQSGLIRERFAPRLLAAPKIDGVPLFAFLRKVLGHAPVAAPNVAVYAGGGYRFPDHDVQRLVDEVLRAHEREFTHVKIKIGGVPLVDGRVVLLVRPGIGFEFKSDLDAVFSTLDKSRRISR